MTDALIEPPGACPPYVVLSTVGTRIFSTLAEAREHASSLMHRHEVSSRIVDADGTAWGEYISGAS